MSCSCHLTINQLKEDGLQLMRACKILLLNRHHRRYLQRYDPMALKQIVEAVMNVEPGIIESMKRAEETDRNNDMQASASCPACADPRNRTVAVDCPYHGHRRVFEQMY
jgi:hypothetical protein